MSFTIFPKKNLYLCNSQTHEKETIYNNESYEP